MQIVPKTDEEIEAMKSIFLLPDADYEFTIKTAEEKMSKSNNPMFFVLLVIKDPATGSEKGIFDYLLSEGNMSFKLKYFCESIGILHEYEAGFVSEDMLIGQSGRAKIVTQKGAAKNDGTGENYADKNVVKEYLKPYINSVSKEKTLVPESAKDTFEDEIPF